MTGKRDKKGRVLRQGERQREDGRYEYRYKDAHGETRSVYSWRLVESDSTPKGKKNGKPLREQEKGIIRDLEDNVNSYTAYRTTLNSFYDAYIETKYELKQSTRTNYKYMYGKYVRDEIGMKNVAEIKYSDIKKFYIHLINDIGFKPNSMETIHTILHPVFNVAVRDGFIRSNPTDGVMAEIKKSHNWEKPKRHALTEPQQERFIEFISESSTYCHWKPLFTVLLGTGARIGEVLGLRWEDCDFKQNIIDINHNLIYRQQDNGKMELHITTPKTKAGTRIVPMFADVRTALLQTKAKADGKRLQSVCGRWIFKLCVPKPLWRNANAPCSQQGNRENYPRLQSGRNRAGKAGAQRTRVAAAFQRPQSATYILHTALRE